MARSWMRGVWCAICCGWLLGSSTEAAAQHLAPEALALPLRVHCTVGTDEGRDFETFGRITAVDTDPSGNIYVVDGMLGAVRVFDLDCRFLRTIGRRGAGPGEFRTPVTVRADSTHVYVEDASAGGQVVFRSDGDYLERRPPAEIFQGFCCGYRLPFMAFAPGEASAPLVLARGSEQDTLAMLHRGLPYVFPRGDRPAGRFAGPSYGFSVGSDLVGDTVFAVVDGYTGGITFYRLSVDRSPQIVRTIDLGITGPGLSADDRRANEEVARSTFGPGAGVEHPPRWSIGSGLRYDGSNRLWIGSGDRGLWHVVELDTERVQAYRLPEGFRLRVVTPTDLIGTAETALGSPTLVKYSLVGLPGLPREGP